MTFNVFTRTREAFEHAIEAPSIGIAFVIVFLTGIFWSALSLVLLNDIFSAGVLIFVNVVQWVILSVLLFIFEILFSGQRRHQIRADFGVSLSIIGKLWIFALINAILFNIYVLSGGTILSTVAGILILIVSLITIYGSFMAVKVTLDSNNARALVVWALLIITYILLAAFAALISNLLIL